jgi:agmatinase
MHNLLKLDNVTKLVQVGVRDFCEQEQEVMVNDKRITTFYDEQLAKERFEGATWKEQVDRILNALPDNIYITLDIDGMEQMYCPGTGTPVPGGLSYNQLIYLFKRVIEYGKTIISFDICEISGKNGDWDAIVGSRLLYNLANIAAVTQKIPLVD